MDVDKSGTDEVQDANAVAAAFLTRITSRWHEIDGDLLLELRALKEDQKAISRMFCPTAEGIAKGVAWAAEMNEVSRRNIYVCVNPVRRAADTKPDSAANDKMIAGAVFQFADGDDGAAAARLLSSGIASLEVITGYTPELRAHIYIELERPFDFSDPEQDMKWRTIQKGLIEKFGCDAAIKNTSRVMRLPGFTSYPKARKADRVVELVEWNDRGGAPIAADELIKAFPVSEKRSEHVEHETHQTEWNDNKLHAEDVEIVLAECWNPDDYEDWITTALALHTMNGGKDVWLRWASRSKLFDAAENEAKWNQTTPTKNITVSSIMFRASKQRLSQIARERIARNRQSTGDSRTLGGKPSDDKSPFVVNGKGQPAPIVANVLTELRSSNNWAVALDNFSGREILMQPLPDANGRKPNHFEPRALEDGDIIRATEWFQRNGFQTMKKDAVADGLYVFAAENAFDPLADKLRSLQWDGIARLETWLIDYCGAQPSTDQPVEYIQAAGMRWMISAVARALLPGCKVDTALVLVGEQGIGKSTVGKVLAYRDEWFSDALPPVHSKEASDHLRGKWLIEFGEMATHSRSDAEEFKAFMTRREEKFRPPYGRKEIEYPRRCVFFGTSNKDAFLKDDTGNRRFWPVVVTRANTGQLEEDRDQLWAEAVWSFDQGERWHMDAAEAALAAGQQEAFMIVDERADRLRNKLTGRSRITILEALDLLEMKSERREQNEMASMFRSIGWRKKHTRTGNVWMPDVNILRAVSEGRAHLDDDHEF
jgi:hypothetical protein